MIDQVAAQMILQGYLDSQAMLEVIAAAIAHRVRRKRDFADGRARRAEETVQDHLEAAFGKLCGERVVVHGAGRTDAGVHALGQCAHVDVSAGDGLDGRR